MEKAPLFKAVWLAAIIACGTLGAKFAEAQGAAPGRTVTLSEDTLRIPLREVIPNFDQGASYAIDYHDITNTSYATRAADVQMTLGNLCHVGRIPRTRFQILQRCPAERNRAKRIERWRNFFKGKGRAPIPKNTDLYVVREGKEIVPLLERELTKRETLSKKQEIGLSFSPPCAFPNPARGEKITELCAQSLPVRLPPFAATITDGEVVVTRLAAGPATAYLVLTLEGREVARVEVRVETREVARPVGSPTPTATPQAPDRGCSFGGREYGVGESVVVFPWATVPFGGRCEGVSYFCRQPDPQRPLVAWHRVGNRRADPQGALTCRVESEVSTDQPPPAATSIPTATPPATGTPATFESRTSEDVGHLWLAARELGHYSATVTLSDVGHEHSVLFYLDGPRNVSFVSSMTEGVNAELIYLDSGTTIETLQNVSAINLTQTLHRGHYQIRLRSSTGRQSFTLSLDPVVYINGTNLGVHPDVSVGRDSMARAGLGLYDTAARQFFEMDSVGVTVPKQVAFWSVRNVGAIPSAMKLEGDASDQFFDVRYEVAGRDVTSSIVRGAYVTPVLSGDMRVVVKVTVTPKRHKLVGYYGGRQVVLVRTFDNLLKARVVDPQYPAYSSISDSIILRVMTRPKPR